MPIGSSVRDDTNAFLMANPTPYTLGTPCYTVFLSVRSFSLTPPFSDKRVSLGKAIHINIVFLQLQL